eukprot:320441-Alexandrium_andersonii.AAC.1
MFKAGVSVSRGAGRGRLRCRCWSRPCRCASDARVRVDNCPKEWGTHPRGVDITWSTCIPLQGGKGSQGF